MLENIRDLMLQSGHISGANLDYVEGLYESWLQEAESVPDEWRNYFSSLPQVEGGNGADVSHEEILKQFKGLPRRNAINNFQVVTSIMPGSASHEAKQVSVVQLIASYRVRGHQHARLDPLGLMHRVNVSDLELSYHHLSEADLNTVFSTDTLYTEEKQATLS